MSYRCGDYEINVYGDPAKPSGIEVGLLKKLVDSEQARKNCIEFMAAVLNKAEDQHVLKALKLTEDKSVLGGMTFEVTPPTAEDAYGGWWVSIYDESELDKSRASEAEIAAITVKKDDVRKQSRVVSSTPTKTTTTKPATPVEKVVVPIVPITSGAAWNEEDLTYSRAPKAAPSSGGGTVYVRGYTRKDGTYVKPHTRRK